MRSFCSTTDALRGETLNQRWLGNDMSKRQVSDTGAPTTVDSRSSSLEEELVYEAVSSPSQGSSGGAAFSVVAGAFVLG